MHANIFLGIHFYFPPPAPVGKAQQDLGGKPKF